jgi:hypothetical protein
MNFRVMRMRELYPSAFKHGVTEADMKHVLTHPIQIIDQDDGTRLYLGAGTDAVLLEVITIPRSDGSEIAIHAMRMRPKYANLLPRE